MEVLNDIDVETNDRNPGVYIGASLLALVIIALMVWGLARRSDIGPDIAEMIKENPQTSTSTTL
jgi:hypothetical protein